MKPYTLQWWLEMLFESINKEIGTLSKVGKMSNLSIMREQRRYHEISKWIRERIIKKYGE